MKYTMYGWNHSKAEEHLTAEYTIVYKRIETFFLNMF